MFEPATVIDRAATGAVACAADETAGARIEQLFPISAGSSYMEAGFSEVWSRIGLQQDFVKGLMDALDRGIGTLVDADMNSESTKLQALQVQQQLGIQALSIANSSTQSILKLFG